MEPERELRNEVATARLVMEEMRLTHASHGTTAKLQEDVEWFKMEQMMLLVEALTRLAYKSW